MIRVRCHKARCHRHLRHSGGQKTWRPRRGPKPSQELLLLRNPTNSRVLKLRLRTLDCTPTPIHTPVPKHSRTRRSIRPGHIPHRSQTGHPTMQRRHSRSRILLQPSMMHTYQEPISNPIPSLLNLSPRRTLPPPLSLLSPDSTRINYSPTQMPHNHQLLSLTLHSLTRLAYLHRLVPSTFRSTKRPSTSSQPKPSAPEVVMTSMTLTGRLI